MKHNFASHELDRVADVIAERLGLHFPQERWSDLERGLCAAAAEFEFSSMASFVQWLSGSRLTESEVEILASHLTVGETYFFRERQVLEILERDILPDLIHSRCNARGLRIWSAGCCTGEEPYTIAMILAGMIPELDRWNITLLATDINPHFLSRAAAGLFREWSFRSTPEWIRRMYFTPAKHGFFEVAPRIKKLVTFAYLNLAKDVYPSLTNNTNAMDIILCRNVLMYLAPNHVGRVGHAFYRSLTETGWLIVSPSDASRELASQFESVHRSGAILYRKGALSAASDAPVAVPFPDEPPSARVVPAAALDEMEGTVAKSMERGPIPTDVEEGETRDVGPVAIDALKLYEDGHYLAAANELEARLSQTPEDAQAMALLARVHANRGNLVEALAWCDKAITVQKMDAGTHYLRATILQEQGALREAVRSLQRILYLDPNYALAHFTLGTIALRLRGFDAAEKHFENARSLLATYPQEQILPESGGITASRLTEIIVRTTVRRQFQ